MVSRGVGPPYNKSVSVWVCKSQPFRRPIPILRTLPGLACSRSRLRGFGQGGWACFWRVPFFGDALKDSQNGLMLLCRVDSRGNGESLGEVGLGCSALKGVLNRA